MNGKKTMGELIWISYLISVFLVSCANRTDIRRVSEDSAQKIIDSLHEYQQAYGVFPDQLLLLAYLSEFVSNELTSNARLLVQIFTQYSVGALVPSYLDEIPTTARGQQFSYSTDPSVGFILAFEIDSRRSCAYTDKYKVWDCDYYGGE